MSILDAMREGREATAEEVTAATPVEAMTYARWTHAGWAQYVEGGGNATSTFTMDLAREAAWARKYDEVLAILERI